MLLKLYLRQALLKEYPSKISSCIRSLTGCISLDKQTMDMLRIDLEQQQLQM